MLEGPIHTLNQIAAIMTASLVNTSMITIAGALVAVFAARSKEWSAATRYGLWWLMLAFVVLAPFVWARDSGEHSGKDSGAAADPVSIKPLLVDQASSARTASTFQNPQESGPGTTSPVRPSLAAIFLFGWIIAAAVQTFRVVLGFLYGLHLKRFSEAADEQLSGLFNRLCAQRSIRRPVRVSISHQISSPAVVGYVRPHVMIPAGLASSLSAGELEQIALHELAHVARYDDWTIGAQRLIEAAAIFHPLVRYIGYRLNLDREMACDDRVAEIHDSEGYAACLAKVAEMNSFPEASAVLVPLIERKSELLARVEVLLDNTRTHLPQVSGRRLLMASAVFFVLGMVGLRVPILMAMPLSESRRFTVHVNLAPISLMTPQAAQEQKPAPEHSQSQQPQPSIYSIVVTSEDGRSSMFGSWSGYAFGGGGREPGTIEFKADNKLYVIRDKGILAEAQKLLRPMEDLGRMQSALGEQQAKLGEAQSKLGEEQAKIGERQLDASAEAKLNQQLQALKAQIDQLGTKRTTGRPSEIQEQLAELQARLAEMQADMGSEQGKLGEDQGRLGDKQGELGRQQGELGRQQGELGRQQEAESKRIEKKLRDLIHGAQGRGLAEQVR